MRVEVNPDKDIEQEVRSALKANDGYCPCEFEKKPETKCMCKAFKEQETEGYCHCGLYRKVSTG